MGRRQWACIAAGIVAVTAVAACADDPQPWILGLDAGSESKRAEITIVNGESTRVFEADLPWDETLVAPNGSFSVVLTVRSLDGKTVGCGIDGPHRAADGTSRLARQSQGGGLEVQCSMSGAISSNEVSYESASDILTELDGSAPADDTTPDATTPDATTPDDTVVAPTTAASASTEPATTVEDFATRFLYSGKSLSVQLTDPQGGGEMVLRLLVGPGIAFGDVNGLPDYCVVAAALPSARMNIDLSPTFGNSPAEMMPDAPDGLVRDEQSLDTTPVTMVQQPAGAAGENVLHGLALSGSWRALLTVFVDGAALADGTVTMDQAAAALTKILSTFTVDEG